jgi:WD40 repeat protein
MKYIILLILLTLGVWAQETAEDLAKFGGKPTFENRFLPMECEIDGVILSSDGKKLIYSTRNGKIYSQEKDKHKQIFQLTPPFLGSNLIWLDYDAGKSEKIAFVNTYKTINILDLRTNEMEKIDLNGSEFVVMVLLKQKKQLLVSASAKYSGDTAYLIDLETKKIIDSISIGSSDAIAISPDETKFAVIETRSGFSYWDLQTKQKIVATIKTISHFYDSVKVSADGQKVLIGTHQKGSFNGDIEVYDLKFGKMVESYKGHKNAIPTIEVISRNEFISTSMADEITLWNFNKTDPRRSFTEHLGHGTPYMFYLQDKDWIVAIYHNGYIQVWDKNTGALLGGLELLMDGPSTVMTECQMKFKNK